MESSQWLLPVGHRLDPTGTNAIFERCSSRVVGLPSDESKDIRSSIVWQIGNTEVCEPAQPIEPPVRTYRPASGSFTAAAQLAMRTARPQPDSPSEGELSLIRARQAQAKRPRPGPAHQAEPQPPPVPGPSPGSEPANRPLTLPGRRAADGLSLRGRHRGQNGVSPCADRQGRLHRRPRRHRGRPHRPVRPGRNKLRSRPQHQERRQASQDPQALPGRCTQDRPPDGRSPKGSRPAEPSPRESARGHWQKASRSRTRPGRRQADCPLSRSPVTPPTAPSIRTRASPPPPATGRHGRSRDLLHYHKHPDCRPTWPTAERLLIRLSPRGHFAPQNALQRVGHRQLSVRISSVNCASGATGIRTPDLLHAMNPSHFG